MPKQIIRLEVHYDPLTNDGEDKDNPEYWPWESMCDNWQEDYGSPCYTRTVKVTRLSGVLPLPTDPDQTMEWHQDNCSEDECGNGSAECPVAGSDEDETPEEAAESKPDLSFPWSLT